jgi:RluA family pseudouridine synthase
MAKVIETHTVTEVEGDIRINDYLDGVFKSTPSKKSVKKALKKGRILVDGKSVSSALWVKPNMKIDLIKDTLLEQKIYDLPLEIVYEDDYFAIVNKPAGLVSSGNQFRTLQNAVAGSISPSTNIDVIHPPKLVHRLDSSTSGLVIIAKTAIAVQRLNDLFNSRKISKKYIAIIKGDIEEDGVIETQIEGKEAITRFQKVETISSDTFGTLSRIELFPQTGRTHQLRIHMADKGTEILGDRIYGDIENNLKGKGLFLTAIGLDFIHPITEKKLQIEIPLPKKFQKYWDGVIKHKAVNN